MVANIFWFGLFYVLPYLQLSLDFLVDQQNVLISVNTKIKPVVLPIIITSDVVFFHFFLEVILFFAIASYFDVKLVRNRNNLNNREVINDSNSKSFSIQKKHQVDRLVNKQKKVRKKEKKALNKNFNPSFNTVEILDEIEKFNSKKRKEQKGYNIYKQKKIANSKRSPILKKVNSLIILSDAEKSKKIEHLEQARSLLKEIEKKKDLEVSKVEAKILRCIANYYQENSDLEQSLKNLKEEKKVLDKIEDDPSVLKRKKENVIKTILIFKKTKQYSKAISFLENNEEIIKKEKIEKMKWINFAGQIYLENFGDIESLEKALKQFENALKQKSNNKTEEENFILTNIYTNLGISYLRKGYFKVSYDNFEKAKKYLSNLGDLREKIGRVNEAKIERMMGIGCVNVENIEKGKDYFETSKKILDEYYKQNPNDSTAQIQIALTNKCLGDLFQKNYEKVDNNSQNSFNLLIKSEEYYLKSLETMDKFSDIDYETSELFISLGVLYKRRNALIDNAIAFLESAERMRKSSEDYLLEPIYRELADCYRKKNNKIESENYSKEAVKIGKKWNNNFLPGLAHAKILLSHKKVNESFEVISKLVTIKPKNQQEKNQLEEVKKLKKRMTYKLRKKKIKTLKKLLKGTKLKDYKVGERIGGKTPKKSKHFKPIHSSDYLSRKGDSCFGFLCTIRGEVREEEVFIKMVWDDEGKELDEKGMKKKIEEIIKKENVVGLKSDYNNRILHCFDDKFDPENKIFEEMKTKDMSIHCVYVFFVQIRHIIDFKDYIKKEKNIDEVDCLLYILELLKAVKDLQENRICHLDIKLANLMLSVYKTLTLIDHECHISFDKDNKEWIPDENAEINGTAEIMPKEVYTKKIYKYVNIYQTGFVLYRLLKNDTEAKPFSNSNQKTTEMSDYVKIEGIRGDTQKLVKEMLNTDYTKRIDVYEAIKKTKGIIKIMESEYFEKSSFNKKY